MKLARDLETVLDAIRQLNSELPNHPELADRLGLVHAFYVLEEENQEPLFGFSKFVGYENLTAKKYLNIYNDLNGLNTEHSLKTWFDEVKKGTPQYDRLYSALESWLGQFGKRPRGGDTQKVRIMIVKPELREPRSMAGEDRRLLSLMIAVADLLSAAQRVELRAAL